MDITDNACEFIEEETAIFNYTIDPVVMIFERVYTG